VKNDFSGFMGKKQPPTMFISKLDPKIARTSKCKVVRKFALEIEKLMHRFFVVQIEPTKELQPPQFDNLKRNKKL